MKKKVFRYLHLSYSSSLRISRKSVR